MNETASFHNASPTNKQYENKFSNNYDSHSKDDASGKSHLPLFKYLLVLK